VTNQQNNQGFLNPYHLTKNENLVNNYQKKKNQSPFQHLIEEVKCKGQKTKIQNQNMPPSH